MWLHALNIQGLNTEPKGKKSCPCIWFRHTSQDSSGQPQFNEDACGLWHTWATNVVFLSTKHDEAVLQKGTNITVASNWMLLWMQSIKISTHMTLILQMNQKTTLYNDTVTSLPVQVLGKEGLKTQWQNATGRLYLCTSIKYLLHISIITVEKVSQILLQITMHETESNILGRWESSSWCHCTNRNTSHYFLIIPCSKISIHE